MPHKVFVVSSTDKVVLLPHKYEILTDFIVQMVDRLEVAESKYGDWRIIDWNSVKNHFYEEYKECTEQDFPAGEIIDLANMCLMLWALRTGHILDHRDVERMADKLR